MPKQFLTFGGSKPIVSLTRDRFEPLIPPEQTYVVASAALSPKLRELLVELGEEQFLVEPVGRNTAPCIGFSAVVIQKRFGPSVLGIFPADHFIPDTEAFHQTLRTAEQAVKERGEKTQETDPGLIGGAESMMVWRLRARLSPSDVPGAVI